MSDEAVTTEAPVTETPEVEAPTPETQVTDELPQWAREKLTKANNEAATYRVRAKDAEEKARQEITSEFEGKLSALSDEKSAIEAELSAARIDSMKLRAALAAGIPGESAVEFAELLKGDNEEDLAAHAEKVKGLMGAQRPKVSDRSQGLGGSNSAPSSADLFGSFIQNKMTK